MKQRRHRAWSLLFHITLAFVLVTCHNEKIRRDIGEGDDDNDDDNYDGENEGIIEEYIIARENAEYELEDFYKTATPGLHPDLNSEAMQELRETRELLMQMDGLPLTELTDLLRGDPGLALEAAD
ncbi:hypothetical protein ElyMa_000967800 [Elysia marginata]|uniref:Uncharacterized protein n=1 Tax=Elysia marginata TaxID=1093978 RepID=A0AAV4HEN9_9GAST|nr:hypothetical protein ElyMa_000967800 [Elysia marginata]